MFADVPRSPKVDHENDENCCGFWTNGLDIRVREIRQWGLDPDTLVNSTKAGFTSVRFVVVHISSWFASNNREIYTWCIHHRVNIISGDFNGAAFRSAQGSYEAPRTEDYFKASAAPLAVEEMHVLIDVYDKGVPLNTAWVWNTDILMV